MRHTFAALAFEQNLSLREVAPLWPGSRAGSYLLSVPLAEGELFVFPFGALVFRDVPPAIRDAEVARLAAARPELALKIEREEFLVEEAAGADVSVADGVLTVDRLTAERAGVVALTVGQSAAMEYYERIVEALHARTTVLVDRLETKGKVPYRTRPLHRFIGEAVSTRMEVHSVLHLLDKPEATWDDPAMDRIYADLRDEFDLSDRWQSLEAKIRNVQEALELILGTTRDFRLVVLEAAIVLLIVFEIVLGFATPP